MPNNLAALLLVLGSVAVFSVTSLLAKWLGSEAAGESIHPLQVSGFRFVFGFLTVHWFFLRAGSPVSVAPLRWHLLRTVSGWAGVSFLFAAAIAVPLADANSIAFLSVVVAMLLSAIALGERIVRHRWFAAGICLGGALLIARPGTTLFDPYILLAVGAALFIGLETVLIKYLSGRDNPVRILWFNNLVGALISAPVIALVWVTPTGLQWAGLVGVGSIMVLTQLLNILAMQRAGVSFVAPFWLSAPFFAALYDWLIFDNPPARLTLGGMLLILAGGLLIYRTNR